MVGNKAQDGSTGAKMHNIHIIQKLQVNNNNYTIDNKYSILVGHVIIQNKLTEVQRHHIDL